MSASTGRVATVNVGAKKVVENPFVIEIATRLEDGQCAAKVMDGKLDIVIRQGDKAADPLDIAQDEKVVGLIGLFDRGQCFFTIFGFAEIEISLGKDKAGHACKMFVAELCGQGDRLISDLDSTFRLALCQITAGKISHRLYLVPAAFVLAGEVDRTLEHFLSLFCLAPEHL